jgi:hypothetical protein
MDTNITEVPWQASIRNIYPDYLLKTLKLNNTDQFNREGGNPKCALEGRHYCGGSIM